MNLSNKRKIISLICGVYTILINLIELLPLGYQIREQTSKLMNNENANGGDRSNTAVINHTHERVTNNSHNDMHEMLLQED